MQCCLARRQTNISVGFFFNLVGKSSRQNKSSETSSTVIPAVQTHNMLVQTAQRWSQLSLQCKSNILRVLFLFHWVALYWNSNRVSGWTTNELVAIVVFPATAPKCRHLLWVLYLFFTSSPESSNCWIINGGNIHFRVNYAWRGYFLYYLLFHSVFHSQQLWLTLSPVLTVRWNPLHPDRRAVWAVVPPSCLHDRRHRKLVVQFCCGPSVSLRPGRSLHLSWRASGNVSTCVCGWGLLRCPLHSPSPWNLLANQNLLGLNKQIVNNTKPTFAVFPALLLHFLFWNH